jgi:hypothetical protein
VLPPREDLRRQVRPDPGARDALLDGRKGQATLPLQPEGVHVWASAQDALRVEDGREVVPEGKRRPATLQHEVGLVASAGDGGLHRGEAAEAFRVVDIRVGQERKGGDVRRRALGRGHGLHLSHPT